MFPIGPIKGSELPLYSKHNTKWSANEVKVLGIYITYNKKDLISKNYGPPLNKIENIIKIWKKKTLYILWQSDNYQILFTITIGLSTVSLAYTTSIYDEENPDNLI